MSDTRLILGICPKCGKKLQIPAELHRFSCLYCGSWLHVEELLPELTTTASISQAQEAYNYVAAHLLACVTGYPDAFRHLTKTEFEPYFQAYRQACRPVFRAMDAAAQARPQEGRRRLWRPWQTFFLDQVEDWSVKNKRGLTGRDALLDDVKCTICLLLIPGIRLERTSACEDFCRILREQWLIRYPKKVFQLTTYEEICQGFQRKKLCFITTAVCAQSGKPDDCPELAAFRSFRDSYLQSQPDGPRLIAQYYDLAPGIVTAIGLMDNPAKVYPFIWDVYLRPCYEALERGRGGSLPEPLYENGPGAGQKVFAHSNLGMSLNDHLPAGFRWVTAIKMWQRTHVT